MEKVKFINKYQAIILSFVLMFSVLTTPLLVDDYVKNVNAMEGVGISLALEDALLLLLGVTGVAVGTDYFSDYRNREALSQSFYNYQNAQGIAAKDLGEWCDNLCQGIVDQTSEIWDNFCDWATSDLLYDNNDAFLSDNGQISWKKVLAGMSWEYEGVRYIFPTEDNTWWTSSSSGAIKSRTSNSILVGQPFTTSDGFVCVVVYYSSSNNGSLTIGQPFSTNRFYWKKNGDWLSNKWSGESGSSWGGFTGTPKFWLTSNGASIDGSSNFGVLAGLVVGLGVVGASWGAKLKNGAVSLKSKIWNSANKIFDYTGISNWGTATGQTGISSGQARLTQQALEQLQQAMQALEQAIAKGIAIGASIADLISLINTMTNTLTGERVDGVVYPIIIDPSIGDDIADPPISPDPEPDDDVEGFVPNIDWTNFFPFCIPWDIYLLLKTFNADPVAPRFEIPININTSGISISETLVIDLEDYNLVAYILRVMFYLLFLIGLMVITRQLIRG